MYMEAEAGAERFSDRPAVWDERVAAILREILNCHDGRFSPSEISHKYMGRAPREERMYEKLNRLLRPKELRSFVEQHPEFKWQHYGKKGMTITWRWGAYCNETHQALPVQALRAGGACAKINHPHDRSDL